MKPRFRILFESGVDKNLTHFIIPIIDGHFNYSEKWYAIYKDGTFKTE